MNISCSKDGTVSELQDTSSVQLLKHQSKINQLVDGCLLEEKQRQVRQIRGYYYYTLYIMRMEVSQNDLRVCIFFSYLP